MNQDEDLEISNRTWDKISSHILKEGYREGISDGQEKAFQKGFDLGYKSGFENAERMGMINGALRALMENKQKEQENKLIFENPHRGHCIMCPRDGQAKTIRLSKESIADSADKFDSTSLHEIQEEQKIHFESHFKLNFERCQQSLEEGGLNISSMLLE